MITLLRVQGLRNLQEVELRPGATLNLLIGANGAGKSSLLEALGLLGLGRSFRTPRLRHLIHHEAAAAQVYVETEGGHRAGMGIQRRGDLQLRLDEHDVALHQLIAHFPLLLMEPGSWDHFSAGAVARRRLLDWGLFHVEPEFLRQWQRYQRALEQRNSLLRQGFSDATLYRVWETQMLPVALRLSEWRQAYLQRLRQGLAADSVSWLPEYRIELSLDQGWEGDLQEVWESTRPRDLQRGHTQRGAHRADIVLSIDGRPAQEILSRGQMKIWTTLFRLKQLGILQEQGCRPCLLVDDFASELDQHYRGLCLQMLQTLQAQVWLTSTDDYWLQQTEGVERMMFHVEQGRIHNMMG